MDILNRIKQFENLHIVLWLLKDTCWMMEFKILGTMMILPTICLAIVIVYHTWKTTDVYINMAILFWICANSFWMILEFFDYTHLRSYVIIPFLLGFLFVGIFYYARWKQNLRVSG